MGASLCLCLNHSSCNHSTKVPIIASSVPKGDQSNNDLTTTNKFNNQCQDLSSQQNLNNNEKSPEEACLEGIVVVKHKVKK